MEVKNRGDRSAQDSLQKQPPLISYHLNKQQDIIRVVNISNQSKFKNKKNSHHILDSIIALLHQSYQKQHLLTDMSSPFQLEINFNRKADQKLFNEASARLLNLERCTLLMHNIKHYCCYFARE